MNGALHVNGELMPRDERHVSALDRGFRYGDGVFETLRVYGGTPFAWDRHMDRLADSAAAIGLDPGCSRTELRSRAAVTLEANALSDAYLRISITRGVQSGTLDPAPAVDPTVVVQVESLPRGGTGGSPTWDKPVACITAETRRVPNASIPAHVKSHNYLNGILAKREASEAGVDDAIMLDVGGWLTESTSANLFVAVDGELRTPATGSLPVLPGITRAEVIDLATEADIALQEGRWLPALLDEADEVFLTNTTWEVRPVIRIDDHAYDVGPISERLLTAFRERIEARCYDGPPG